MMKKLLAVSLSVTLIIAAAFAALLFIPKGHDGGYRLKVGRGQSMAAVGRRLADDGVVYNRTVLLAAVYLSGNKPVRAGSYPPACPHGSWPSVCRGGPIPLP